MSLRITNRCTRSAFQSNLSERRMPIETKTHCYYCHSFGCPLLFLEAQAHPHVCYAPSALLNWPSFRAISPALGPSWKTVLRPWRLANILMSTAVPYPHECTKETFRILVIVIVASAALVSQVCYPIGAVLGQGLSLDLSCFS